MQIGFITPELSVNNGWSNYSLSLIRALRQRGIDVSVISARDTQPLDDLPAEYFLPNLMPRDSGFIVRLMAAVPRIRASLRHCDLIHITAEPYALLTIFLNGKRPIFLTAHGSYINLPRVRRWPVGALYRHAFIQTKLICVSSYTANIAQSIIPNIHLSVVNNGVDFSRFRQFPPLSESKNGPIIVTSGGVKRRKGTLELVRAIAVVRQKIPNVQCIIIGSTRAEPKYFARVQREVVDLGLNEHVRITGFVPQEELLMWYGAADVFVLPSMNDGWKFEGFGLVHLEASAAGLPVIGTRDCGIEDAIDDGITGLLVSQENIARELPEAILETLTNPQRAAQMGEAGFAKARSQSWDMVAAQMIALYEAQLRPTNGHA